MLHSLLARRSPAPPLLSRRNNIAEAGPHERACATKLIDQRGMYVFLAQNAVARRTTHNGCPSNNKSPKNNVNTRHTATRQLATTAATQQLAPTALTTNTRRLLPQLPEQLPRFVAWRVQTPSGRRLGRLETLNQC